MPDSVTLSISGDTIVSVWLDVDGSGRIRAFRDDQRLELKIPKEGERLDPVVATGKRRAYGNEPKG